MLTGRYFSGLAGVCLGVVAFLSSGSSALALTWTNTVKDGWYWPGTNGMTLSSTGITHFVQTDNNTPTNINKCYARSGSLISQKKWFSVHFTNDFPSSAAISGVTIYVQHQLSPGTPINMTISVSTNQDQTMWKAGQATVAAHAQSPPIPATTAEQEYIYDLTSVLDTPEKINKCEILMSFFNNNPAAQLLYFDYIKIEVDYANQGPPIMGNGVGATNIGTNSVTFNGEVTGGGPAPKVYLCWGDNDGGAVWANWDRKDDLGDQPIGSFFTNVTGLAANKTYYYRCYGTNTYGEDYADASASFMTLSPIVQFTATSSNGSESVTPANLQVSLSVTSAVDVTVLYTITGGTASNTIDYTVPGNLLTIPAGAASADIPLSVVGDLLDENNETVVVTISSPTGGILGANTVHTYTINDDDAQPTVSFSPALCEIAENVSSVAVTVARSAPSERNVSVYYATSNGSAESGLDYSNRTGTLSWPANDGSPRTIIVPIIDDSALEGNQNFFITLSTNINCDISGANPATVTIYDDDRGPPILDNGIGPTAVSSNSATLNGLVTGTGGAPTEVWIYYDLADGVTNKASWASNTYIGPVSTGAIFNTVYGLITNRTYYYRCYASNTTYGGAWAPATTNFMTGPPTVQFTLGSSSSSESAGKASVQVRVVNPSDYAWPVTVNYAVTDGTATVGSDYTIAGTSLTIPAGQSTSNIYFTLLNDLTNEFDETAVLSLSSPGNALLGASSHVFTIIDDDPAPPVSFTNIPYSVMEDGTNITITMVLLQGSAKTVSINYGTSDGSGLAGQNYTSVNDTVTWLPGVTGTRQFTVPIIDNTNQLGLRTFNVILSANNNCVIGGNALEVVTINEDDVGSIAINNGGGASNVQWTTATLNGFLSPVFPAPTNWIFWGPTDGGTETSNWKYRLEIGTVFGLFSTNITGLLSGTNYYYRCYAQSWAGYAWANATAVFTTKATTNITGTAYYVNDGETNDDQYCTGTGNDLNSGTNRALPKESVQAILDTYNLGPGDCVWVDAGAYSLAATLTIANDDFGAAGNPVVIRGSTSPRGSVLNRGSPANDVATISAAGSCYVRLESLGFTGGNHGLNIQGQSLDYLQGVEVVGCRAFNNRSTTSARHGIYLRYCNAPVVANNICYSNGANGIYVSTCSNAVVVSNTCYFQKQGGFNVHGVFVFAGMGGTVTDNRCYGNADSGVRVSAPLCTVADNTCSSNGLAGIFIEADSCTIRDNTCYTNGHDGIEIGAGLQVVSGNVCYSNGWSGISCSTPISQAFRNNLAYNNGGYAIWVNGDDSTMVIENNTLVGPGGLRMQSVYLVTNRNNIFWATGAGTNAMFAVLLVTVPDQSERFQSDHNDLYTTGGANVGSWGGYVCGTLADWRAASQGDANSISADPLFVSPALGDFHEQSVAGSWHGGVWQGDAQSSPCIDAGNPWSAFSNEQYYGGLLVNQGAYGNTIEASKTYYTGPFFPLTAQAQPAIAGSASFWPVSTNGLYPTNRLMSAWTTATNANYVWTQWVGSVTSTATNVSFFLKGTSTLYATYNAITWTIVATSGPNGSIAPSGSIVVTGGTSRAFSITPDGGASITNVFVDGGSIGVTNSYTFNNVTANHTISAWFNLPSWTITATAGPGGNIAPNGAVSVAPGGNQAFTISTNAGSTITNVFVDGQSIGETNSYAFSNVTNNHTIHVTFFAPTLVTAQGTPYSWLDQYGLTDYENDDLRDGDSDKMLTWKEYRCGTIPTSGTSVLEAVRSMVPAGATTRMRLTIPTVTGRYYYVESMPSLPRLTQTWTNTAFATSLSGAMSTNSVPGVSSNIDIYVDRGTTNKNHFYRIRLE